jgi:hypothetical protein
MGVGIQRHALAALPPAKRPGTYCSGCLPLIFASSFYFWILFYLPDNII